MDFTGLTTMSEESQYSYSRVMTLTIIYTFTLKYILILYILYSLVRKQVEIISNSIIKYKIYRLYDP